MSAVTVFVDDAVQGRLPMVCVRTGEPADGLHRIHQSIGGSSPWAFLLVFLGPIGWIALFAVSVSSRSRELLVRVPKTHAAVQREARDYRVALVAGATTVLMGIAWIASASSTGHRSPVAEVVLVAVASAAVAALVTTTVFSARYLSERVGIELDASGRWVTLRGVHPAFADAVRGRESASWPASSTV